MPSMRSFYSDEVLKMNRPKSTHSWLDESFSNAVMPRTVIDELAANFRKIEEEKKNKMIIQNSYISVNGTKYRLDELEIDHAPLIGKYHTEPAIARAKFTIDYSHEIRDKDTPKVRVTKSISLMDISKVIFNYPATIVFWADGTKTIVKCKPGDQWDPHAGISAAISKKFFGNQVSKWVKKAEYAKVPPVEEEAETNPIITIANAVDKFLNGGD